MHCRLDTTLGSTQKRLVNLHLRYQSISNNIKNNNRNNRRIKYLKRKSKSSKNLLYNPDFKVSLDEEIRDTHDCTFAEILEGKEDEYFIDDFKNEIIEAFNKIAPSERKALLLKLKGYNNEEISKIMNITYNNVTNKIAKARKKLKEILNYNK